MKKIYITPELTSLDMEVFSPLADTLSIVDNEKATTEGDDDDVVVPMCTKRENVWENEW